MFLLANTRMVEACDISRFLGDLLSECFIPNAPVQRIDTFCFMVLSALPWCAETLAKNSSDWENLLQQLHRLFDTRKHVVAVKIFSSGCGSALDILDVMWGQVQSFLDSGFVISSTLKGYTFFEDELKDPKNVVHSLPRISVPSHDDTFIYFDKPTALHLFYSWDDSTKRQEETQQTPYHLRSDVDLSINSDVLIFASRLQFRPVDRMIVALYVFDTLYFWNSSREDCVKKLRLLPVKGATEHLVVESILSHLFMVPQCPFAPVYYSTILVELCKLDSKYPVVVAEAMEELFDRIGTMDNEMVERLVQLFSFVLANFGFKWFWEEWTGILEQEDTCKKLFIYEVFSALMRHSYKERLLDVIPAVFHKFIPDDPRHFFRWDVKRFRGKEPPPFKQAAESIYNSIHAGVFTADEITLELEKLDWHGEMKTEDKIDILVHCVLVNGVETITHQMNILRKFKSAFEALVDNDRKIDMALRLRIVQASCSFWENSPQHKLIVIRQLLDLHIVEPVDVIHWLFSPSVTAFWERAYPWEVVRNALDGLIDEIMEAFKEMRKVETTLGRLRREREEDSNKIETGANTQLQIDELSRKQRMLYNSLSSDLIEHLKLVLFELFSGFRKALGDFYKRTAQREEFKHKMTREQQVTAERTKAKEFVWHKSAISHFNEMGRKYLMFLFPWLDDMREKFFVGADSRILDSFDSWRAVLFRRWCVARGFTSGNFQNNACLQLFRDMVTEEKADDDV